MVLLYYALFQSHIVALAAAAQPAKHNFVVLCNRGQYITHSPSKCNLLSTGCTNRFAAACPVPFSLRYLFGYAVGVPVIASEMLVISRPALIHFADIAA